MRLWGCAIAAIFITNPTPATAALRRLTQVKPIADSTCVLPAHERTIREGVLSRVQQGNKSARNEAIESLRSFRLKLRAKRAKPIAFNQTILSTKLRIPSETAVWSALDLAMPISGGAIFATDPARAVELTDSLHWILRQPEETKSSSLYKRFSSKSFESIRGFLRSPTCRGESCLPKHPDIEAFKNSLFSARQEALKTLRERKLPGSVAGMEWAQIQQIQEVDFPYYLAVGRVLRLERQFFAGLENTLSHDRVACDPENRLGQPRPSSPSAPESSPTAGAAAQSPSERPGRT